MLPVLFSRLLKPHIIFKLRRDLFSQKPILKTWPPFLYSRKDFYLLARLCHEVTLLDQQMSENYYARKIVESSPKIVNILKRDDRVRRVGAEKAIDFEATLQEANFENLSLNELCSLFEKLSLSPKVSIAHSSCSNLRLKLQSSCGKMTDEQLLSVLRNLSYWPPSDSPRDQHFYELCRALDEACLSRSNKWNINNFFMFVDAWYSLKFMRKSNFVFKGVGHYTSKPNRLSPQEVVLLLFYLNILRRATKNMSLFVLENRLLECANELSLDELAVAVMGFFKGEKSLSNEKLMSCLMDKLITEIKSASDITFTSIIKILRMSLVVSLWHRVGELFDVIVDEMPRLSVQSCAHAALLSTRPQLLHEQLLCGASQKLVDNITKCRLKDMEKVVFPLVQMAYDPQTKPCIFETILEELEKPERNAECDMYPKSFIALIHYFCLKGSYPEIFIRKVLDPHFFKKAYGSHKYNFGREILFIDTVVGLELPSYSGPRLSKDISDYLSKRYAQYPPDPTRKQTRYQEWLYDIIQTAEMLYGKEHVASKYLLPNHPKPDIVVHLDENMNSLPIDESLKNAANFTGILKAPGKNYYALVPGSINMYLYNRNQLNGESLSKIKSLKHIGYNPILIPYVDWPSKKGTFEKIQYLKNLLSSSG